MNLLHTHGWRIALILSAIAMIIGGPMHPSSDAEDSMREELAVMTAGEGWVLGHSLIVVSTVLLVIGLALALRSDVWPAVRRPIRIAVVAYALYAIETVFHLMAFVDSHALAHGGSAPIAMSHIALGAVLYPVSGAALVYLAWSMGQAAGGWRRIPMVVGIVAGVLHALSVPLVLLLPDAELSPMFASAAMLTALWTLVLGLTGAPRAAMVREPSTLVAV